MIGFAVIGAGFIGPVHAGNIASHMRARLEAVVDLNGEAAAALAATHGAAVATLDGMLADPAVTAVVICTPAHTHADIICRAARAGKAIFCEKPIDLDLAKVAACQRVLEETRVPFCIGFNRRFDPSHAALRDAVVAGEITSVEMLVISSRDPEISPPDYVAAMPYGIFYDTMIHDFDIARWIMREEPVQVFARATALMDSSANPHRDPDTAMVILTMRSGALVHVNSSFRAVYGYDQRIEAFGAGGMLISRNHQRTMLERYGPARVSRDVPPYFFIDRYREAYAAELDSFVTALETGAAPAVSAEDGRQALVIAYAAVESAKSGKPVDLA
jgi:myo-inositol 2-dehydrogenase / D-chiro-inositol 1-dehydrogenase